MTTSPYGRSQVQWPDLGSPAGAPLHTEVTDGVKFLSDNLLGRWSGSQAILPAGSYTLTHNFNLTLANLRVRLYEAGAELSEADVTADFTIAQVSANAISVTNDDVATRTVQVYVEPIRSLRKEDLDPNFDAIIEQLSTIAHNDTVTGTAATTGVVSTSFKRLTVAGTLVSLAGIVAPASVESRIMILSNLTGAEFNVLNDNAGATATNRILTGTGEDLTVAIGASLLVVYDETTTKWRVVGGSGAGGGLASVEISTNTTAVKGKKYLANTTGGPITLTLPLGSAKAVIGVVDSMTTFATNNLTITPQTGEQIANLPASESLILDVSGSWVELYWDDVNNLWALQTSQSTGPGTAILQGGNSLGTALLLGTNDNFGVNIETNGTIKLAVSAAGAATIGATTGTTTTPHTISSYTNAFTYGNTSLTINNRNSSNAVTIGMASSGSLNALWYSSASFPFAVANPAGADLVFVSSTGAATIGPSGFTGTQTLRGNTISLVNSASTQYVNLTSTGLYAISATLPAGAGTHFVKWASGTSQFSIDTSSRIVKNNIIQIPYGLEEVMQLQPSIYDTSAGREVGLIADEVLAVLPELVSMGQKSIITKDEADTEVIPLAVDYSRMCSVLIKAIQEQQVLIQNMQAQIDALQQQLGA